MRKLTLLPFIALLFEGCAGSKQIVVDVTTDVGHNLFTYAGKQSPERLIQEIRLNAEGDTLLISPLLNGQFEGTMVSFHKNGKRDQCVTYLNGRQTGPFRKYDVDGDLLIEGELVDGKKHGIWSVWYDATQMSEQCNYVNDVRNGNCTFWYLDGSLRAEETYSNGSLTNKSEH